MPYKEISAKHDLRVIDKSKTWRNFSQLFESKEPKVADQENNFVEFSTEF